MPLRINDMKFICTVNVNEIYAFNHLGTCVQNLTIKVSSSNYFSINIFRQFNMVQTRLSPTYINVPWRKEFFAVGKRHLFNFSTGTDKSIFIPAWSQVLRWIIFLVSTSIFSIKKPKFYFLRTFFNNPAKRHCVRIF